MRNLCVSIMLLLLFPSYAFAEDDMHEKEQIYHIYEDINMIPTTNFAYSKPKITIKTTTPLLESQSLDINVDDFNQHVQQLIKEEVADFKDQVALNQPYQQFGTKQQNNLYIDFDTSVLNIHHHPMISIRFNVQGYVAGTSHPYHRHRVLNYDLSQGKTIELADLFNPTSNYVNLLSDYSSNLLLKRLPDKQKVIEGTGPALENYKNWNINPSGLLITFDESKVAPLAYGSQTVLIPYTLLKPIISVNSPIAACVKYRKKRSQNNILTGGFMDAAFNASHRAFDPILS